MKRGFTLVELSIVLVIIGLLIGGILVGQSMISTAKIQAQIRQLQQFDIAGSNFRQRFNQLPGDCSICSHISSWSSALEGNNDKIFQDQNGTNPPVILYHEPYFFFIDLYVMGLLTTPYQLVVTHYDIGIYKQFPAASIGRGGVVVSSNSIGGIYYTFIYRGTTSNEYTFGQLMAQGNFSTAEALAMDTKLDDGNPTAGNVQAVTATPGNSSSPLPFTSEADSSSSCVYNGIYNQTLAATNICRLVVKSTM